LHGSLTGVEYALLKVGKKIVKIEHGKEGWTCPVGNVPQGKILYDLADAVLFVLNVEGQDNEDRGAYIPWNPSEQPLAESAPPGSRRERTKGITE